MVVAAPPLAGEDWLIGEPISGTDLRGRFTLLSFWSAECETSLGHLHELQQLQNHWPDLEIIAVHSPRAPYARDRQMVIDTLARHRTQLRILHDPALETWSRYNPLGWPASVLLHPSGKAVGTTTGAGVRELLEEVLQLHAGHTADQPGTRTVKQDSLPTAGHPSPLRWPGSVAMLSDGRIAIADTGNRRVVVGTLSSHPKTTLQFTVRQVISGIEDIGEIHSPGSNQLLFAKPASGAVWKVDLASHEASPIATGLDRPVGLTTDVDGSVVVTEAGSNRIVRIAANGNVGVIAGSGRLGSHDGRAGRATLAQPVSVTPIDAGLCFVDAASNNVRILTKHGRVASVTNNGTTEFGLVDGAPHLARFQRPTAVLAHSDRSLLVTDTGNSRVRQITDRDIKTIGANNLCRPEGLGELPGGTVLVSDTGNHRLVHLDLASRETTIVSVVDAPARSL